MENDRNELDHLFKQAFSRLEVNPPDENIAWKKMQEKLHRKKIRSLIFQGVGAGFIGLIVLLLNFKDHVLLPYSDLYNTQPSMPEVRFETDQPTALEVTAEDASEKTSTPTFVRLNARDLKQSDEIRLQEDFSEDEIAFREAGQVVLPVRSGVLKDHSPTEKRTLQEMKLPSPSLRKKSPLRYALTIGYMIHNHWVENGSFMGNNLPSVGVLVSKNIHPNVELMTGLRYVQRNNMAYKTFSKIREVYNQEELNLYTLYVNGTHWAEIPIGIHCFLPDRKVYFGAFLTTDVLLYQSAKLGVKTQIPALGFESEERLKRAWNYDSGIPRVTMGFRTELGTFLSPKSTWNLFAKVSPYSGEPSGRTNKNIGFDLGIEWRYCF
ncbi:MAG: hypothetical protein ACK4KT_04030 [Thermaurantimonas sp.]